MAWGPFFSSPRAVGMDLDDGAVQRHRLQLDADQLGALQVFEDPVEHPVLGPTIHTGVDRVPVPKALRQPSPLAPLLGDVQDRVEHLQIGHADIATLSREAGLDACVLRLGELHPANDITNRPIAHQRLDRAVDRFYRRKRFTSERERVEYLFASYERMRVPLAAAAAKPGTRRRVRRRGS